MGHIEKRFSVIDERAGCCLLVDEVTSCITGSEIYGTIQARLSVDEALTLGGALIASAEATRLKTTSPERMAINKALAAARAHASGKTKPTPPWEVA